MSQAYFSTVFAAAIVWLGCVPAAVAEQKSATQTAAADKRQMGTATKDQLDEVVVTGSSGKARVLETSYAATVVDQAEITRANPVGLTELANMIPGLQGEYANGEVNSNLNVRGTQAGFMAFISLQEDGLPVQYSPFFSEYEIRNDLTYDHVEAVLGGPSGIFTAQGAAATLNFISRVPHELEGQARQSITDYGQLRTDLFYGGPIGNNGWYGSAGGYYRRGDDSRSLGFTSANGGQMRARIGKEFDRGSFSIALKLIDDSVAYTNPLPVDVRGRYPTSIPGFDARHDTLVGPDVRYISEITPGGIVRRDLADGQNENSGQLTIAFDYKLNDRLNFSNKARYNNIRTSSQDLRGGPNATIYAATAYLATQLPVLRTAFPTATAVQLVRVNDGTVIANPAGLNGNGLLTTHDALVYDRNIKQFIDDARFTFDNQFVTMALGVQYWDITTKSDDIQDTLLIDVRHHSNRYDVQAVDAGGNVVGHLTDKGVVTYGSVDNYGGLDTKSINPYFNVQANLGSRWKLDAGVRHEHASIRGYGEDVSFFVPIQPAYYNPQVLATQSRLITANGNVYNGHVTMDATSWTVGANVKVTNNLAFYGRYASAADMGYLNEFSFFSIPGFGTPAGSNLGLTGDPTRLKFSELGVRYLGKFISGSVTAFHTKHLRAGTILVTSNNANLIIPVDTIAKGAEFQMTLRPTDSFHVGLSGVIMKSRHEGSGYSGQPLERLPETQIRLTPVWNIGKYTAFGAVQYYSHRYQDRAATRLLPSYTAVDAGFTYNFNEALNVTLQANNLFDTWGFTSGNFREPFQQSNAPYGFASVIPGRTMKLSVDYHF